MQIGKLLIGISLLMATTAFGQKNQIQVLTNEIIVGRSLVDSAPIYGVEHVFPQRIHGTFLDTTTGFLTVQLRGLSKDGQWLKAAGHIVQYDLSNKKVLWNKKTYYQLNSLLQFNNIMIYSAGNIHQYLDVHTGQSLWEVSNSFYHVIPSDSIGLGYNFRNSIGYSTELEGVNLNNGSKLWNRSIHREFGWNDVFYLNDSTIVVVAGGLHSINLKTGKGWDYYGITGKNDYRGTAVANAAGLALGLMSGTFMMTTAHNVVLDLVSNTVVDSSHIYFASHERIVKIDKQTGQIIWIFPFKNDLAGKSSIFIIDDVVFMVNKGMALSGNQLINFGKPFFAAFDSKTGKKIFFSVLNTKNDPILNFTIHKKEVLLVFKNRIQKYSTETGEVILEQEFPKDTFAELRYFVGSRAYITAENVELSNQYEADTTHFFVITSQGKILVLDPNLNVTKTLDPEDFSFYYHQTADYKLIAKEKNTLVVNSEGKKIAEIEGTSKAFVIDKTLYYVRDNKFVGIELEKMSRNQ